MREKGGFCFCKNKANFRQKFQVAAAHFKLHTLHFPRNALRRHYEQGLRAKQSQFLRGETNAKTFMGKGL
jgi:hypothetical protein